VTVRDDPALVTDATVEVNQASKWFGQKVAVSNVTCSFGPGLTGLLGPNGAGKTTLLRMITGLLLPSEGDVSVLGTTPRSDPAVYREMALVPEEDAVYGVLTARRYVEYAARLADLDDPEARAGRALAEVGLEVDADRAIAGYSKGMRQRAKVAAALVNEAQVLILDEPLNGTDPVQRAHLISLFRRLGRSGHTVIVSSHVLQEVERMTERVIAMVDGKLAAAGDIGAIRRSMTDIPFRVRVAADRVRELGAALMAEDSVNGVTFEGTQMHIETSDLYRLGTTVPALCRDLGARITLFQPEDESLESVFRYLVRRR
jgi:ABC-2 type transport system ATP-binding protein